MKSTAAILATAMFVGDRMTASPSLADAAAVEETKKNHVEDSCRNRAGC